MSDAQLQKFVFASANEVNVVAWNEKPWFVGKNVSDILGYQDTEHMVRRLDEDEYKTFNFKDFQNPHFGGIGLEGVKRIILLTESGLYHAIFGSKKPEAQKFRRWVTEEVLPSIRKHGAYMTESVQNRVLENPEEAVTIAKALKEEHEARLELEGRVADAEATAVKLEEEKTHYIDLWVKANAEKTKAMKKLKHTQNKAWGATGGLTSANNRYKAENIQLKEKNKQQALEIECNVKTINYLTTALMAKCSHKKKDDREGLL